MMENCQTLYEASITNIETRNSTQKENYRQTHLTDARIDAKILRSIIMLDAGILSKKQVVQVQCYVKKIMHHKVEFLHRCKGGSTLENQ